MKARVSAPASAPSPIDAMRKPNPAAPTFRTSSAKSGISVSRFMANSEKTATVTRRRPTIGSRLAYDAPSANL